MKKLARLIGTALACLAVVLAGAAPAVAAPKVDYVALGDSFSAGTGAITALTDYDGTPCLRSAHAYPHRIAAARGWNLNFQACQGATTADVMAQLGALSADTDVVTIGVGGNDTGFAPVLLACSTPGTTTDCLKAVTASQAAMVTTLPASLTKVYAAVRKAAPRAQIIAVGYPQLFSGTDCSPATDYTRTEQTLLNAATNVLNASIATTAARSGVRFVNPTSTFKGHAWCAKEPWINGPAFTEAPVIAAGSLHPNVYGQAAYATAIGTSLRS